MTSEMPHDAVAAGSLQAHSLARLMSAFDVRCTGADDGPIIEVARDERILLLAGAENELARALSKRGDTVLVTPTRVLVISNDGRAEQAEIASLAAIGASDRGVFSKAYRLELFLHRGGSWDIDFASPEARSLIQDAIRGMMS